MRAKPQGAPITRPKKEKKTERLVVRVSQRDMRTIDTLAELSGKDRAKVLRSLIPDFRFGDLQAAG